MGYDYSFDESTDDDYFRLNIFGGSRYADYMRELGLAFDVDQHLPWPKASDFNLTDDEAYEELEYLAKAGRALSGEKLAARKRYEAATKEVQAWHGPETPGVPTHKIAGSNDGWHVTAAECKAVVRLYEQLPPERIAAVIPADGRDYWDSWVDYIRRAIDHNGFRTY